MSLIIAFIPAVFRRSAAAICAVPPLLSRCSFAVILLFARSGRSQSRLFQSVDRIFENHAAAEQRGEDYSAAFGMRRV